MSNTPTIGNEVSVDEQRNERGEDGFEVVEETPELRPTVEHETQAKVDTNHPDATPGGLTLAAEERLEAREWEIERTQRRFDRRQDSDREARTRRVAARGSVERRYEFGKRAASVDPRCDPDRADPRERLSREMLGAVNQEATRLAGELDGWTRAAISRRLAERIDGSGSLLSAVVGVVEEAKTARGTVVPIGKLEEVYREEVSIEGRITTLWEPSSPAIQQVGLIEDNTGRTRFTAWKRSRVSMVDEGEQVRFRGVQKSWYQGRCSVALTGDSLVEFPD
jgi:ssDNA-binding replication factor A large subunit